MIKGTDSIANWLMVDSTRGEDQRLYADSTGAEVSQNIVDFTDTGFTLSTSDLYNSINKDSIYIAIRDIS